MVVVDLLLRDLRRLGLVVLLLVIRALHRHVVLDDHHTLLQGHHRVRLHLGRVEEAHRLLELLLRLTLHRVEVVRLLLIRRRLHAVERVVLVGVVGEQLGSVYARRVLIGTLLLFLRDEGVLAEGVGDRQFVLVEAAHVHVLVEAAHVQVSLLGTQLLVAG